MKQGDFVLALKRVLRLGGFADERWVVCRFERPFGQRGPMQAILAERGWNEARYVEVIERIQQVMKLVIAGARGMERLMNQCKRRGFRIRGSIPRRDKLSRRLAARLRCCDQNVSGLLLSRLVREPPRRVFGSLCRINRHFSVSRSAVRR